MGTTPKPTAAEPAAQMRSSIPASPRVSPPYRAPRFSSPRYSAPRDSSRTSASRQCMGAKPVIAQAQLIQEAYIKGVVAEALTDFTSTVLGVRDANGGKNMRTSIPDELTTMFGCKHMLTVHGWKQSKRGCDVRTDISTFKAGDEVKMLIQSVGAGGKHSNCPLLQGVPDPDQSEQKHTLTHGSDSTSETALPSFKLRMSARNTLSRPSNTRFSGFAKARRSGNSSYVIPARKNMCTPRGSAKAGTMKPRFPAKSRFPGPAEGYSLDGQFKHKQVHSQSSRVIVSRQ